MCAIIVMGGHVRNKKENDKWGYFPPMQTNHVERCYSLQSSCFPIKLSSTSVFCLIHFLVTCWGHILGLGWTWTKLIPLCRHWTIFLLVPQCLFKQSWRGWVKARSELHTLVESALFHSNRIGSPSSSYLRAADSSGEEKPPCTIQWRCDSPESNILTVDLSNAIGDAIILNKNN